MKPYSKYKTSGIQWIGDIPEHWGINKFKRVAFYQEGPGLRNWQFTDDGIKVICVTNIVPPKVDFTKMTKYISEDEYNNSYRHFTVNNGDLLIASSGASWGKVAEFNSDETVILNTSTIRINKGEGQKLEKQLIKWIIQSQYIYEQLNTLLTGSCQPNFGPTHLDQLYCVYPKSLKEQIAIANFIDHKTTQIDTAIAKKQQLIELLEEERKVAINEVVISGINNNVDWVVKKFKYVANLKSGETITADDISEDVEFPVFGGNGFRGYTNSFTHDGKYVLIGRQGALCGNINYAEGKFWASEHAIVVTITDGSNVIWLGELLRSMNLNQYSQAAAQPGLAIERIQNLSIPVPPISEQYQIVAQIVAQNNRINTTITKINREIELLKEYRQSLIFEAVTGKIKIDL